MAGIGLAPQMNTLWRLIYAVLLACACASAQSIAVPYRGLDYSMVSREGITVMVAPLNLTILNYSTAHVWVTNGSQRAIHLEPQYLAAKTRGSRQPAPGETAAASDSAVVTQVMEHAKFNDVLALVRAYERNLYGFNNNDAINYYQARKQLAAAEGGGKRLRAAAMVSAILLAKGDVPPGEFREGTVFFPTPDKKPQFLSFTARIAGLVFSLDAAGLDSR
jgi:hypothetical protein